MSSDYGNSPYILWIDQDAFKASSAALLVSMENCGFEKVWKFKNVHRMRVFLQRSRASEFIRSGTKFVVITSTQDMRHTISALQQTDVVDMLGALIVFSSLAAFDSTCRWVDVGKSPIHQRSIVTGDWETVHSILSVWRTQWNKSDPVSRLPSSADLASKKLGRDEFLSILGPSG